MEQNCNILWKNCLDIIQKQVAAQSFVTWFQPIVPLKLENNILTIQVPSQFFYEWLEDNYVTELKNAIHAAIGPDARLEYSVIVDSGNTKNPALAVNYPNNGSRRSTNGKGHAEAFSPFQNKIVEELVFDSQLNSSYSFENFVEGDCNRLARAAGMAVAKKPGVTSFNPLMLYGGVGVGKTHLVQAIGNEIRNNLSDKFVLYVHLHEFMNQFIEAIKNNRIQEFQNFYMQVDVLIIDDVQFLSGKDKIQEMFFYIFNQLHQSGKQIIMTSDCPPRDMKGFQERLVSRFKWGLTADLMEPDFETKLAIISRKMDSDGIEMPNEVAEYLAYSVDTNLRDLDGVLNSLMFHSTLLKRDIDLELAKQVLKNIVKEIEADVSVDYIQKTVAEYFKLDVESLKAKVKKREIVVPRQVAIYLCKRYTQLTLAVIGQNFGGRDHSTIIHALQSVEDMMETDAGFKSQVDELNKKIKMKAA
jgi:chromosomal replication initiator protein